MKGVNLSIEDAPLYCAKCNKPLCLRKQVINLVLGNTDEMFCLICLGELNDQEAKEVLLAAKEYIKGRDCFKKEWLRYESKDFCPDPKGCFLLECFAD